VESNQRLRTQDHRINRDYRNGLISGQEAHDLHQQDHEIRGEEQADAWLNDGHIAKADQHAINQDKNGVANLQ